jgi:ferredoxin
MTMRRKIIEIDEDLCDGCGQCIPSCAEGAIQLVDGKAKLIEDRYCDGLGACLGECPTGALSMTEREAEPFDELAVEEHLRTQQSLQNEAASTAFVGCPSARPQIFPESGLGQKADAPMAGREGTAGLSHWPIQIRLVPPTASFLKGAHLLVAADCSPVAYPRFHEAFLKGRVVLLGCPKFDEVEEYIQKFGEIFAAADIKDVVVLVMEVPCCEGLPMIVQRGMKLANKQIPAEKVVISPRGDIVRKDTIGKGPVDTVDS